MLYADIYGILIEKYIFKEDTMHKLTISNATEMSIAIKQEIGRSEESRYDHRLHGILLVSQGISCYQVSTWLGQHSTTVERWVKKFEKHGFAGLQDGSRPGRPRRLTETQWEKLNRDLRTDPRNIGYEQNLWDGKLLQYHLNHFYKVNLGVRQCQRLFGKMGFRLRKPRPVIAHANHEVQKSFKKTAKDGKKR